MVSTKTIILKSLITLNKRFIYWALSMSTVPNITLSTEESKDLGIYTAVIINRGHLSTPRQCRVECTLKGVWFIVGEEDKLALVIKLWILADYNSHDPKLHCTKQNIF